MNRSIGSLPAVIRRIALVAAFAFTLAGVVRAQPEAPTPPESPTPPARPDGVASHVRLGELFVHGSGANGDFVKIGGNAHVKAGESVDQLVVVFGDAVVDGTVSGDMVVVWGDATINGHVGGDMVTVLGSAKLGPDAKIDGQPVVVGGRIDKADTAKVSQLPVEVNLLGVTDWFKHAFILARPIAPGLGWVWLIVLLHFLIYFLVVLIAPRPVEACVRQLDRQLLPAFGAGLLGFILFAPLIAIVGFTVVGILLIPFVIFAFIGAVLLGKAAFFQFLGLQLLRRFNAEITLTSLAAFVVGFALVTLLYMVPLLGFVVWGLLPIFGLGAALLAGVEAWRSRPRPVPPVPTALRPVPVVPVSGAPSAGQLPLSVALDPLGNAGPATDPLLNAGYAVPPVTAPAGWSTGTAAPLDAVNFPRAGFWIRLIATFLDLVLVGLLTHALHFPFALLIWIAYHIGMWTWKGTTIGGIVCNLRVVRLDGGPVDVSVAAVRALAAVFSFVALFIGFFWAGWSVEQQSWHDKIAGTVIVRVPRGTPLI